MRKSTSGKGSSENRNDSTEPDPKANSIQMELEQLALKTKNADLTKAYAKLSHDYYELSKENIELKKDLMDLQSQLQSQRYAYKNMVSELKNCTPAFMEIANLLLKISENGNRNTELTPRTKAVTQPVKPHAVNGTVLMNPTISLTRMSGGGNDAENCLPSTSSGSREYNRFIRNIVPDENGDDDERSEDSHNEGEHIENVTQQRCLSRVNGSLSLHDNNPESPEEDSDDEENQPVDLQSRSEKALTTILEESRSGSIGEVKIFLSRLSDQDMEGGMQNNTRTSIEASVADNTYLNIETTLIDNQLTGGRLRTDIMVFSPKSNSTRLGTISPYTDMDELKVSSNEIQSSVVTPSVNIDESVSRFGNIPTPSMSVLGDIDKGSSRLAILAEDPDEVSPITTLRVTKRARGKSSKRQTSDRYHNGDSSPLSARSSNVARTSNLNFVSTQRGGSADSNSLLTSPTVLLEKLEHMDARSASVSRVLLSGAEEEENDAPRQSTKPRSKKNSKTSKSSSKSPSMPAKRAKIDRGSIKDIQIRLSKVISPDSSEQQENQVPTTSGGSGRPQRAARPKNLKDLSLKCKMRRMF